MGTKSFLHMLRRSRRACAGCRKPGAVEKGSSAAGAANAGGVLRSCHFCGAAAIASHGGVC
jgi:hypothetical protein